MQPKQVADAIFYYLYNRSPLAIVLDVFRAEERSIGSALDPDPDYVHEKVEKLRRSTADFYGYLDDGNQQRFVECAIRFAIYHERATSRSTVDHYAHAIYGNEKWEV